MAVEREKFVQQVLPAKREQGYFWRLFGSLAGRKAAFIEISRSKPVKQAILNYVLFTLVNISLFYTVFYLVYNLTLLDYGVRIWTYVLTVILLVAAGTFLSVLVIYGVSMLFKGEQTASGGEGLKTVTALSGFLYSYKSIYLIILLGLFGFLKYSSIAAMVLFFLVFIFWFFWEIIQFIRAARYAFIMSIGQSMFIVLMLVVIRLSIIIGSGMYLYSKYIIAGGVGAV